MFASLLLLLFHLNLYATCVVLSMSSALLFCVLFLILRMNRITQCSFALRFSFLFNASLQSIYATERPSINRRVQFRVGVKRNRKTRENKLTRNHFNSKQENFNFIIDYLFNSVAAGKNGDFFVFALAILVE